MLGLLEAGDERGQQGFEVPLEVEKVDLALANVAGSLLGTHLALKHGTGFVRSMFIVVVSALICKTSWDAFLR